MHRYQVKFRHRTGSRVYHVVVTAKDPDDARLVAAIRDPEYFSSVAVKKRGEVIEPEQADPITAAKAREYVEWRGCLVEVV